MNAINAKSCHYADFHPHSGSAGKELYQQQTRVSVQVLSLTSCATLSQLPNLSGFIHFQSENSDVSSTSDEKVCEKNLWKPVKSYKGIAVTWWEMGIEPTLLWGNEIHN